MVEKIKRACHFCYTFNQPWKWKEQIVGSVEMWGNYPRIIFNPICWKCAILWQQEHKKIMGYEAYINYDKEYLI